MAKTPVIPDLSGLSTIRSDEYKTIFANLYRVRVGIGEITLIFSRITHTPSIAADPNVLEEQVEIVMTWSSIKMLQLHLASLVSGIEQEVGDIPIPSAFLANPGMSVTAQREAIRSFGLSRSPAAEPAAAKEEDTA